MTMVPAAAAALSAVWGRPAFSGLLAAEEGGSGMPLLVQHIIAVVVFAAIGFLVFGLGIYLFVKICPFSVRKEIEEDQNTSLGIIMGAVLLGLAWIIAAAIQG